MSDETTMETATPLRRIVSMRLLLSLVAAAMVAATAVGVSGVAERNMRRSLHAEVQARLVLEARNLANLGSDALLDEFPELLLMPVVQQMQAERPELAFVAVVDHQGLLQGHVDPRRHRTEFTLPADLVDEAAVSDPDIRLRGDAELLVASAEIRHGRELLGTAYVALQRSYLDDMVAHSRRALIGVSALLLLLAVAGAVLLMHKLLSPIAVLRAGLDRIGRGDLDTPMHLRDRTELGLLADTVNDMAGRIKASQRDLIEKERLSHEMDLARSIQQSLLPDACTRNGPFVIEGSYQAAAEVGGDYFDVFDLPGGRTGLIIADVAGKGLGGCLVTSMLAALLRCLRERHDSPAALLVDLERNLVGSLAPGVFVTAFYGILDPAAGTLAWASAAHSPLLVRRAADGSVESHTTRGIPLGAIRNGLFPKTIQDHVLELRPGDVLLQYTDGLNEAPREADEAEFGLERIADFLRQRPAAGARDLVRGLGEAVAAWSGSQPQSDDLTLLAMACEGSLEHDPHPELVDLARQLGRVDDEAALTRQLADAAHLVLPADLERLHELRGWLDGVDAVAALDTDARDLVESGLYEVLANLAEHADAPAPVDVWLLEPSQAPDGRYTAVIRDKGVPFDPGRTVSVDLTDPEVRRRGRGLGLPMLRILTDSRAYLQETAVGNLHLLRFDLEPVDRTREINHV